MIQANELRLNNLFQTIEGNVCCRVCQISNEDSDGYDSSIRFKSLNNNFNEFVAIVNKAIEPIPLTIEILEKCGFKHCGIYGSTLYGNEMLSLNFDGINGYYNIASFTYLHQLQNLYFALTFEELEVKL